MRRSAVFLLGTASLLLLHDGALRLFGYAEKAPYIGPKTRDYPAWSAAFPRDFDEAFRSRLSLQRSATFVNSAWRYLLFNSSVYDPVVPGLRPWVFSSAFGRGLGNDWPTGPIPSFQDLEDNLELLRQRRDLLAKAGIPYLVVLVPDKQAVYPEHLPEWLRPTLVSTRERMVLRGRAKGLDIVDLWPDLMAAKPEGQLYWTYDTHWNLRGSLVGYHATRRAWAAMHRRGAAPAAPPALAWSELRSKPRPASTQDLLDFMGISPLFKAPLFQFEEKARVHWQHFDQFNLPFSAAEMDCDLFLSGDSMAMNYATLFGHGLGKVLVARSYWDFPLEALLQGRPKMVIEEIGEHRLWSFPFGGSSPQAWLSTAKGAQAARLIKEFKLEP